MNIYASINLILLLDLLNKFQSIIILQLLCISLRNLESSEPIELCFKFIS